MPNINIYSSEKVKHLILQDNQILTIFREHLANHLSTKTRKLEPKDFSIRLLDCHREQYLEMLVEIDIFAEYSSDRYSNRDTIARNAKECFLRYFRKIYRERATNLDLDVDDAVKVSLYLPHFGYSY